MEKRHLIYNLNYKNTTILKMQIDNMVRDILTGGMPACSASSAAARAVNGVSSAGLTIIVHPAANAGATCKYECIHHSTLRIWFELVDKVKQRSNRCSFLSPKHVLDKYNNHHILKKYTTTFEGWPWTLRVIIARGKFHGVMAPTTPTGCQQHTMQSVSWWNSSSFMFLDATCIHSFILCCMIILKL